MEFSVSQDSDFVEVVCDGLAVVIGRSQLDGALWIDVSSESIDETRDAHPGTGVPRLRLSINDHVEQLDSDGNWVEKKPYPEVTVLDHLSRISDEDGV